MTDKKTTDEVPTETQEQVRKAVDAALAKPNQAQGFLNSIPDIDVGEAKSKVLSGLDAVLGGINTLQQYSWVIPQKYIEPIQKLEDALTKVKGWLD